MTDGGGGPSVNGSMDGLLTPELLYKMNKKIAQLTKVVYGLNTRGEELEQQLTQAKRTEESLRDANADLSRKLSVYKSKFEGDVQGAGEAQFYRLECEALRRRLDEVTFGGSGVATLRDELDQTRRREAALLVDLEHARLALANMKEHHDFIMRERDAQNAMEEEKANLEWKSRMAEMESRYKAQARHLTEDRDSARAENDVLRSRASDGVGVREQLAAALLERDRLVREWELKLQLKEHEADEERIKHVQEKREKDQKIRQLTEDKRRDAEMWEEKFRSAVKSHELQAQELKDKVDLLASMLRSKEMEFEDHLKAKVAEWKSQWDAVEDNLQAEILRLKEENAVLLEGNADDSEERVRRLEEELRTKAADYDLLASNLKMRIKVAETEAKNLALEAKTLEKSLKDEKDRSRQLQHRSNLQIDALERHLREETERHKITQSNYENHKSKVKANLESQVQRLLENEAIFKEEQASLLSEVEVLKVENEGLNRRLREKEREHSEQLEKDVKAAEMKTRSRLEKTWLEKLRKSEENAAQDMERAKEAHRRSEADLKKEIAMVQKSEVEAKRLNEEFKKKVRQLRQSESELQQRLSAAESAHRDRSVSRSSSISAVSTHLQLEQHTKELAAIQAKYESEVEALRKSLARKEEELTTSRSQATEAAEALARSREEQLKIKAQLTKEKEEIEEKHRKEREREERERREREEKERKEAEERRKKEDEEEAERKRKEQDVQKKSSESEGTEDGEDDEEGGGEEEKETEAESNKRKIEKMHMEMLLLKQQNEEFEEMVREKYRRQVELELQIGEINNEVTQKEAAIQSVRVELSYAKNETALTQAKVKQLEEELLEQKQRVEALEKELDTAERELKRMEILQEKLRVTEGRRNELQAHIDEIELERDEEIKIIQDALDEAAQEREELLATFEKEIEKLNSLNAARETQMLQEFEDKLKELEQQHKSKLEEKDREAKTALQRSKRMADEEDVRQRLERLKSDLNSEWEDKLRSECARLKSELDSLHSEEKHLAVESIRVQKEQELQEVRKGVDGKVETLNKEISELKKSLAAKDEFYQQEIDEIRTRADRDVWELRRKLQKLDEASYDRQQLLEDKHREDLERLREEYADKMAGLEAQLSCVDVRGLTDLRAKLEAVHKQQMEHLGEQHRLSMERLRDELEAEKVQAAEEARVIVSRHHEYINESLKEQLAEAVTANTQYREEIEAIKFALCRREEVIKSLEEDLAKLKASKGGSPSAGSPPPTAGGQASPTAFQFPHEGSQGSRSSQDRLSNDADDDGHKGSGLLGKMFGGGWFSGTRARDSTTPANSPLSTGSSKKNRQST